MMLFSWTSATNCARIYNEISQQLQPRSPISWPFNLSVTLSQVYEAFTLLSLLEDCQLQKSTLVVPHKGTLGASGMTRFAEAVHVRNECLWHCSQPELFHYCKKCTWFYPGKHLPQIILLLSLAWVPTLISIGRTTAQSLCCCNLWCLHWTSLLWDRS